MKTTPPDPCRILVIDDTPTIHDDFRKILAPEDSSAPEIDTLAAAIFGAANPKPAAVRFELDAAAQGQTGLALVEDALAAGRPYAVAFVDMRMPPGWDGLETIRRLWAADPHLQIVICTAYSDHSWAAISEKLGQSDNLLILKKPFDNIEVLQLAHALARKWRLAREVEAHVAGLDGLLHTRTAELRRAEEGFTAAFEASPLAQAIVSLDNPEVIAVNSAFERVMGLGRGEAVGLTPDSCGRGFDPARWKALLARLGAGEAVDDHACIFQPTPQSAPRELLCSARPLTIRGRQCTIWVLRDVTTQLETERQLRQSQKMEAVGQLAAGVAHDFNNLLTVIQGYTDELLARPADSATREMAEPVRAAAARAAQLTRQLLVFSRKESVRLQPLELTALFDGLRPLLRRLIAADIEIEWDVPPQLAAVTADPANIEQVIVNLVVNARDAMPKGGRVTISARETTLAAGSAALPPGGQPGRYIELRVADTGTGISPDVLPRIFEPFFTTKESGKGTGLGLSTVYSIVRQQGGWIQVQSQLGVGTTFVILQPVTADHVAAVPAKPAGILAKQEECRNVLVVEDDPNVQSLLSSILTRRGIAHTVAEDGVEAQEIWRTAPVPFDLLITDIVMPKGVSGVNLASRLRAEDPQLGVVLSSGFSEFLSDPANLALPGAAPRVLPKPFGAGELLTAMHEACAARAA